MALLRAVLASGWSACACAMGSSAVSFLQVGTGVSIHESILQRAAAQSQVGLANQPDQGAMRTLLTLDANRDGRVDAEEVKMFALTQGLDSASATREFAGLDLNADGTLDSNELSQVLGSDPLASNSDQATSAAPAVAAPASKSTVAALYNTQESARTAAAASESTVAALYNTQESARTAAAVVVEQLRLQADRQREAETLEHRARELRANSTELARLTEQKATVAAEQAASAKATELLHQLGDLEDKAKHSEIEAAALRAKAKAELVQADELMVVADQALKAQSVV